jgi:hypothetical protein
MRRVALILIRLYPATWRARYGEEFETLLEDSSSGWPANFDLLKGAIKMQLSTPTFPKLALTLSIAGLLIGLLVSYSVTPGYVSRSELSIEGSTPGSLRLGDYLKQTEQEGLSRTSLARMIQDPGLDLYPEERARIPLEDVIETMRTRAIRIRVDTPPSAGQGRLAFSIAFAYRDRVKVQHTVQALIARFSEASLKLQPAQTTVEPPDQVRRLEARVAVLENRLGIPSALPEAGDRLASAHINLTVLDPPSMPVAMPNRSVCMFYGFVAGIVAASLVAIFRRRPPPLTLCAA